MARVGALCALAACWAPQARAAQEPRSADDAAAPRAARAKPDVLAADPRLKVKVTLKVRRATIGDVLEDLAEQANVGLVAQAGEVSQQRVAIRLEKVTLKDALDAVAAAFHYTWERRESGVFVLRARRLSTAEVQRALGLGGDPDPEVSKHLRQAMEGLPPEMLAELGNAGNDYGVPLGALPPTAQQAVSAFVAERANAVDRNLQPREWSIRQGILANLGQARVRWGTDRNSLVEIGLSVTLPSGAVAGCLWVVP